MAFDEQGNPVPDSGVPKIVDKLAPIQAMRSRRMKLNFQYGVTSDAKVLNELDHEERRIMIDALEYVEVFSDDAFSRLMARHALGTRPR